MQSELRTAAKRFTGLAEEFCRIVDSVEEVPVQLFLAELNRNLPHLYGAGVRLPEVQKEDFEPVPRLNHDKVWGPLYQRLKEKLGQMDLYLEVFNPTEKEEAIPHSLADDVADIWWDLKQGFAVLEARGPLVNAIWEWRFGFWSHWGQHATSALRAIHYLRARVIDEEGSG